MKLIYISGVDGCGITTQAKLLVESLKQQGFDVCYCWLRWEPTFQKVFRLLMNIVVKKKNERTIDQAEMENKEHQQWMSFKRKILSNVVFRNLWWFHACLDYYLMYKRKFSKLFADIIVVDRYYDDFIIDQACNLKTPAERANGLAANFFLKKFRTPDLKIIIDVPAKIAYQRKLDGTPLDALIERESYYKIFFGENSVHLDGIKDIETLANEVENCVKKRLIGDEI